MYTCLHALKNWILSGKYPWKLCITIYGNYILYVNLEDLISLMDLRKIFSGSCSPVRWSVFVFSRSLLVNITPISLGFLSVIYRTSLSLVS